MTPAEFHDRVQQLLDDRRDPLADASCTRFLADHPEHLDALARLQRRLGALQSPATPRAGPARESRRRVPVSLPWVVGLAASVLCAWSWLAPAAEAKAPIGRVLAATLQTQLPLLQPAIALSARHVLLAQPNARIETFVVWSTP